MSGLITMSYKTTVGDVFDQLSLGQKQHMANKLCVQGVLPQNLPVSIPRAIDAKLEPARLEDYLENLSPHSQASVIGRTLDYSTVLPIVMRQHPEFMRVVFAELAKGVDN